MEEEIEGKVIFGFVSSFLFQIPHASSVADPQAKEISSEGEASSGSLLFAF